MEPEVLPGSLEWWHVILSMSAIVFTFAMKWFGDAFKMWANKLDAFQNAVNKRLDHMEQNYATQTRDMTHRFEQHRENIHHLTVNVERRVTWIEATIKNAPCLPGDEDHPRRRWYENQAELAKQYARKRSEGDNS